MRADRWRRRFFLGGERPRTVASGALVERRRATEAPRRIGRRAGTRDILRVGGLLGPTRLAATSDRDSVRPDVLRRRLRRVQTTILFDARGGRKRASVQIVRGRVARVSERRTANLFASPFAPIPRYRGSTLSAANCTEQPSSRRDNGHVRIFLDVRRKKTDTTRIGGARAVRRNIRRTVTSTVYARPRPFAPTRRRLRGRLRAPLRFEPKANRSRRR